jgi:hypothetical protein
MGCGSGGGASPGQAEGSAGITGTGTEIASGAAGQAGGQAGASGEAGQSSVASTGVAGAGSTGVAGAGGATGVAGAGGASTTKPTGGAASGGKTAATSSGTAGTGSGSGGNTAATSTATSGASSQYIDAINAVRAQVSKPANYTGTWAPLPNVVWSDTVAASAQAWANNLATTQNCKLVHESQNTYGENLAMGTNLSPKQAVDMWASEKDLYTWSATYTMADFNAGSGHYTQLVWRKSTQVGCGSATCGRNVVISCRFSPPGNFMGQAAY